MPYSEKSHSKRISSALAVASMLRTNLLDNIATRLPYSDMYLPRVDLYGKTAIVTGANSGIGYECARALAGMGARVVLACRSMKKGEEARQMLVADTGSDAIEMELLDCGSGLTSAVAVTSDGFEQTYQANHLAHVLLTITLLNRGYMSPDARIVSVSSAGFYGSDPLSPSNVDGNDILAKYEKKVGATLSFSDMMQLYTRSKAAQAVWTMVLQRYLSQIERWKNVTAHSCHPGTVKSSIWTQPNGAGSVTGRASDLFKAFARTFGITNEQGAVVPVWLAIAAKPATPELRGMYWDRLNWKWVSPWSLETKRQNELWDKWCKDAQVSLVL